MTDIPEPATTAAPAKKRTRGRLTVMLAGAAVVVLVGGFFFGRAMWWGSQPTPEFGSLAAKPDSSLRGAVAFLRPPFGNGCVWIVGASGENLKKVACVKGDAGALEWLPDGRIQATRYKGGEGTGDTRSWIFNVTNGAVEDVPRDQIPPRKYAPEVVVGPRGEKVTTNTDNGRLVMKMSDQAGTRTLLSVAAPDTYTFGQPTWSPDGEWFIVKDDLDRLLLVTTADPSRIRVLTSGGYAPAVSAVEDPSNPRG